MTSSPIDRSPKLQKGLGAVIKDYLHTFFSTHHTPQELHNLYAFVMKEVEKPLIEEVLHLTKGNQSQAALLLGLNRNTLRKKVTELQISVTSKDAFPPSQG